MLAGREIDYTSVAFHSWKVRMADATIMIVDDNVEIRTVVSHLLTKADYHVIQAVDGREAITLLSAAPEAASQPSWWIFRCRMSMEWK